MKMTTFSDRNLVCLKTDCKNKKPTPSEKSIEWCLKVNLPCLKENCQVQRARGMTHKKTSISTQVASTPQLCTLNAQDHPNQLPQSSYTTPGSTPGLFVPRRIFSSPIRRHDDEICAKSIQHTNADYFGARHSGLLSLHGQEYGRNEEPDAGDDEVGGWLCKDGRISRMWPPTTPSPSAPCRLSTA